MTDAGVNSGRGPGATSSTLLTRLKAQEPEAWRRFVYLYSPLVYRWCRRAGLRAVDAADVGQEVFQAVAGTITTFHHDQKGDSFRGWLRTITRNKVLDFVRRQPPGANGVGGSDGQARLVELAAPEATEPEEAAEQDDRLILCRRAVDLVLANCKEETRQAFLRVVGGGQHPADVARDLGLTANAVYLAKSHILRRIREEFAALVDL